MSKSYIASPFFTELQLDQVKSLETLLDSVNEENYSPRKFGNSSEIKILPEFESIKRQYMFDHNIDEIYKCDKIIVNLYNNRDIGTMFELGVALGRNKKNQHSIKILLSIDGNDNKDSKFEISKRKKLNKIDSYIITVGSGSSVLGTIDYLTHNKLDKVLGYNILVDTNNKDSYIGGIILLGYLYSLGQKVSYISNFVSKSNLMITQSGIDQYRSLDNYLINKKVEYKDKDIQ